jgi:peptide/nickel transport system substrate-binding protein
MFVRFDTLHPVLADPRVRQAFNYAVDKELIIETLLGGYGEVLNAQPLGKQILGEDSSLAPYPYDPDQAKALLDEAGFDYSTPLTLYTPSGRYAADREISEAIGGMLSDIGVTVTVEPLEWGVWIEKFNDGTLTPMTLVGFQTLYPDAFTLLSAHSTGVIGSMYSNPDYDAIVQQAGQTVDPDARLALYHQAVKIIHDDPVGLYLHQQVDLYATLASVSGFTPRPDEMIELLPISRT